MLNKGIVSYSIWKSRSLCFARAYVTEPCTQERSFPGNIFDKLAVNMTSCFEVEEESNERQENSIGEIDKTLAALEAIPVCLNWGQIFSLPNETCQHMLTALRHPKL